MYSCIHISTSQIPLKGPNDGRRIELVSIRLDWSQHGHLQRHIEQNITLHTLQHRFEIRKCLYCS